MFLFVGFNADELHSDQPQPAAIDPLIREEKWLLHHGEPHKSPIDSGLSARHHRLTETIEPVRGCGRIPLEAEPIDLCIDGFPVSWSAAAATVIELM